MTKPKEPPKLNEFFLRGVPVREAVDAVRNWEALNNAQLRELGFDYDDERLQ